MFNFHIFQFVSLSPNCNSLHESKLVNTFSQGKDDQVPSVEGHNTDLRKAQIMPSVK